MAHPIVHHVKRYALLSLVGAITVFSVGAFIYISRTGAPLYNVPAGPPRPPAAPKVHEYVPVRIVLPAIQATVTPGTARVTSQSPAVFAYAHGTAAADGKIFIGMANAAGNRYAGSELVIFGDDGDISRPAFVTVPLPGEVDTMAYDRLHDKIYFELSNAPGLALFSLDPHTYAVSTLAASSTIDAGRRPAIVTDGTYVYGITNTDPSLVFRAKIDGGDLTVSRTGHIANGHSAAIGIFASSTELYFGGDMSNGFEKDDAGTLAAVATTTISPCGMSDDMPYVPAGARAGYVYTGCESVPYGIRVRTDDLSYERFQLPGASLGMYAYGDYLYNAAQDGYIDVFPGSDLADLRRYRVTDEAAPFDAKGQDIELNEILLSPRTGKLFFTAWYGIEGLYQVATSTP